MNQCCCLPIAPFLVLSLTTAKLEEWRCCRRRLSEDRIPSSTVVRPQKDLTVHHPTLPSWETEESKDKNVLSFGDAGSKGGTVPRPAWLPQETLQCRKGQEMRPHASRANDADTENTHSTSNKNLESRCAMGTTCATEELLLQSQIHKRTPWKQQEHISMERNFQPQLSRRVGGSSDGTKMGQQFTPPEETCISRQPQVFLVQSDEPFVDRAPKHYQAEAEIHRILQSHTAWEVLGGANHAPSISWRREYLRRSLLVHPDKCKYARAGEAFGRLTDAYRHLTEGSPWYAGSTGASSQNQGRSSSTFRAQQHQHSYPFTEPHRSAGHNGGDPFDFFRDAAQQAFRAGEFSKEEFSDVLGQPAAVGGALVGAMLGGALGSILGGALGSRAGSAVALEGPRSPFCGGGRCERCRARTSLGSSFGGAAGTTAGLALGATAGAGIGARLGSAIASAFDADNERRPGREHASASTAAEAETEAQFDRDCKQQ